MSKKSFANCQELTVELQGMKCVILERVQATVKIVSYPSTMGRPVMKSMETESQGLMGTGRGMEDP